MVKENYIMSELPKCVQCASEYTYEMGDNYACPECGHEWPKGGIVEAVEVEKVYKDVNGNVLVDGDTVTVLKDLKVKGTSSVVKVGTKVKGIRLTEGANGHDIECKVSGIGSIWLKTKFVKKV